MVSELQQLRIIAKELGIKSGGTIDEVSKRVGKALGLTKTQILKRIRDANAANKKAPHLNNPHKQPKPHKPHKQHKPEYKDDAIVAEYCGEVCFAGNKRICPKCDSKRCYCIPKCKAVHEAYTLGIDQSRMSKYADALGCPIISNMFNVGDVIVGVSNASTPIFGIVTDSDGKGMTFAKLAQEDTELIELIERAYRKGYTNIKARDIANIETSFGVTPINQITKKSIRLEPNGYYKDKRVYFDLYNDELLYLRKYSINEMDSVIKRISRGGD